MISDRRGLLLLVLAIYGTIWQRYGAQSFPPGIKSPLRAFIWSIQKQSVLGNLQRSALERFRTFSCIGRNDQLYPDIAMQCETYYRCLGGVAYSYACSNDEAFDMESQECKPKSEANCAHQSKTTEKCLHQPDGFYPNYEDNCASYYSCYNETLSAEGKCAADSIWDSATDSCVSGPNVACTPPSCLGLEDGFYPLPGSACTSYYSCRDGLRTDMLCSHGSVFDYMQKKCISGHDAVCYEKACDGKVNGLHAAPEAPCDTFYECFNGAMVRLQRCPTGQIFDGRLCRSSSKFTCIRKEAGLGSCVQHVDGMFASEDPECRGFFFCRNSQLVRHFECGRGLVFNGRSCVNNANFICTATPPVPSCFKKFDGYYTIDHTGCNRFYRCANSQKLSEHSCPGNHVFNGRQCVSSRMYECPSKIYQRKIFNHH